MEHHGNNHHNLTVAVIPARFASTRLPGKMLLDVGGLPMVIRTARQAALAREVNRVIIATDDERILEAAAFYEIEARMTSPAHRSGTDRVAEVAESLDAGTIVVNVQGDEPIISPRTIDTAVAALKEDAGAALATTFERLKSAEQVLDPNIVKVVLGNDGKALYFSRSPIPFPRDLVAEAADLKSGVANYLATGQDYLKHTGLYVYRREFLLTFRDLPPGQLENAEMLEQLRALENGFSIAAVESSETSIGVDSPADLERVRELLAKRENANS